MNPTPTICIAISFEIPNNEQASGISNSEPPGTPDAPQADAVASTLRITAAPNDTGTPKVLAAVNANTVIVIAAPFMLIVAPRGIDTEYKSLSRPSFSHNVMLTGMLAAELLVKNAVIPDSFKHFKQSG